METRVIYFVRSITKSVPFVESTWILCPTEAKQKYRTDSLTITMMLFFGLTRAYAGLSKTKNKILELSLRC